VRAKRSVASAADWHIPEYGVLLLGKLDSLPRAVRLVLFPVEPIDIGVSEELSCLSVQVVVIIVKIIFLIIEIVFCLSDTLHRGMTIRDHRRYGAEFSQVLEHVGSHRFKISDRLCFHASKVFARCRVHRVERGRHPWPPTPVDQTISPLARIFDREVVEVVVGRVGLSRRGEVIGRITNNNPWIGDATRPFGRTDAIAAKALLFA
jgi:hypothetical protein